MSLDYSYKKVANSETVITDENWPLVQNVIFYTMSVGINEIKASNVKEFRRRLLMMQQGLNTAWPEMKEYADRYSLEFLESLIGLATNASTKTVSQFNKDLLSNMESRIYTLTH